MKVPTLLFKAQTYIKADWRTDTIWINPSRNSFTYLFESFLCFNVTSPPCLGYINRPIKKCEIPIWYYPCFYNKYSDVIRTDYEAEFGNIETLSDASQSVREIYPGLGSFQYRRYISQCWKWLGKEIFANQIFIITGLHISGVLAVVVFFWNWITIFSFEDAGVVWTCPLSAIQVYHGVLEL